MTRPRDFEQYISAYKNEGSKYCEINSIDDIDDLATRYLLKQTLVIGHGAICTEGKKEENKNFYKAYYKMADINNHHILDRLELDFNEIYDFNFYDTDAKGFVKAINRKLLDITDEHIIPTPSVTPTKSDPYEQYLVELEQLKIDDAGNNAKIEQQYHEQLTDTYKEFVETAKDVINRLESTIEQQERDIKTLKAQLKEKADTPAYAAIDEGQGDTLLILGAVMQCIKSIAKNNYTQTSFIDAIIKEYPNTKSISQSTLSKKFSKAKTHLKQNVTP